MTGTSDRAAEPVAAATPRLAGARVLFVVPTLGRGGAERQAMLLGRYLATREAAVVSFVSVAHDDMPTDLTPELDAAQLSHTRFTLGVGRVQRLQRLVQLWDMARFTLMLRRYRPDVLLPYTMLPNILCGLTWRTSGAALCLWNQRDEGRARMARWLERSAVRHTPFFLSNSSHGAEFVTGELGVSPDRVAVIHNGIHRAPAQATREQWRADLGAGPDVVVATMVANLHRFKDHETLIAAWRVVLDRLGATGSSAPRLALAGAPGDRADAIGAQIESLNLGESVRMLGPVTDVTGLLEASDVCVFSSRREGLPNGVLEGMAAGLPVVATDHPGIREAVGPDGEAWLARPGDAAHLADRLVEILRDARLRQSLGARNRARVDTVFSVEAMGSATVDVICRLWRDRARRS